MEDNMSWDQDGHFTHECDNPFSTEKKMALGQNTPELGTEMFLGSSLVPMTKDDGCLLRRLKVFIKHFLIFHFTEKYFL